MQIPIDLETITKNNLKKIINCYCRECVGFKDLIPSAPEQIKINEIFTNEWTCICMGCCDKKLAEIYGYVKFYENRKYFNEDKFKYNMMNKYGRSWFTSPRNSCIEPHFENDYVSKYLINFYKLPKNQDEIDKIIQEYIDFCSKVVDIKCIYIHYNVECCNSIQCYCLDENFEPKEDVEQIKVNINNINIIVYKDLKINGCLPYKQIKVWHEYYEVDGEDGGGYLYVEDMPYKEMYNDIELIKKICYYGEYSGYKLIYTPLSKHSEYLGPTIINNFSPCREDSFASKIIKYRNFDNNFKKLSKQERNDYYSVIDQYCYECNKYRGACFGHDIPDEDEYKSICGSAVWV
jgi:hypothetical protein